MSGFDTRIFQLLRSENYSARALLLLVSERREPGFSRKRIARGACERHAGGRVRNASVAHAEAAECGDRRVGCSVT